MAPSEFRRPHLFRAFLVCWSLFFCSPVQAQQQSAPSADKQPARENPAQIELLETGYRFEDNSDSRKEVHTRVKINSELGVRQFARLNFDYNRSFESIDLPLVRITHPGGGTVDILPSAITDNPNPAVLNAPAYQDVRIKSVRILGLAPGDFLEYRVITTVSHHPLAPDFWLDHSFDRSGVVREEHFEIDVPASCKVQLHVQPEFTYEIIESENRTDARVVYRWKRSGAPREAAPEGFPDVLLTTYSTWDHFSQKLIRGFLPRALPGDDLHAKTSELTQGRKTSGERLEALYDFVSQKIRTVDLPVGTLGFLSRRLTDIMTSGYANPEEKVFLLAALCKQAGMSAAPVLAGASGFPRELFPSPGLFPRILVRVGNLQDVHWLDPTLEVAPLGVIQADLRGKRGFLLTPVPETLHEPESLWPTIPLELPYASTQLVKIDAALAMDGKLNAKVHYALRGDNELLLRVAFHKAPKEKWKDLAQLLSLSDGFRGKVTSVTASDSSATREPFTLDYEITMPKFVDWSKKPVRIAALLPQIGLPDPPAKPSPGAAASPVELGTPLEVETRMTLHLPPGTTTQTPTGTSVRRDYATFASQYSAKGPTITASRHINFLLREVSADRAADYNAFLRAVRNDEAQDFALDHPAAAPPHPLSPKSPKTVSPSQRAKP